MQTVCDNFTNVHATAVSERRAGGGKSSGDTWCAPAGGEHGGVILGDESVTLVYVYGPRRATIEPLIAERRRSLEEQED